MDIRTGGNMVVGMHGTDDAGERFGQCCRVEPFTRIVEQTSQLHHLIGNHYVGGIPSDIVIGVTRSTQHSDRPFLVVQGRLDGELFTRSELGFPFGAHFDNLTGKFVSDDDRIFGDIARDAFMDVGLVRGFVRRHADAVAHNFGKDLILTDLRQLKLLQPEVVLAV